MWDNHDDNWGGKLAKSKDRDIDINIDVNVNTDGERCFDKIIRAGGSAVGGHGALNLLDVVQGIHDVQKELRGGKGSIAGDIKEGFRDGFRGGVSDGVRDELHDGIRDGAREGFRDGARDIGGVIGIGVDAALDRGGLDFNPPRRRDEELPYIDCELGRLLEQNKTDILDRHAKMGAVLKDAKA